MSWLFKSTRRQDKAKQKEKRAEQKLYTRRSAQAIQKSQSDTQQRPRKTFQDLESLSLQKNNPFQIYPRQPEYMRPPIIHPYQLRQLSQTQPVNHGLLQQVPKDSQESENNIKNDRINDFSIFDIHPGFQNSFMKNENSLVTNKKLIKQTKFKSNYQNDSQESLPTSQANLSANLSNFNKNQEKLQENEKQQKQKKNEEEELNFKPRHKGFFPQNADIIVNKQEISEKISHDIVLADQLTNNHLFVGKKLPESNQLKLANKEDDYLYLKPRHKGFFHDEEIIKQNSNNSKLQTLQPPLQPHFQQKQDQQCKVPIIPTVQTTPNSLTYPTFPNISITPTITNVSAPSTVGNRQIILTTPTFNTIPTLSTTPITPALASFIQQNNSILHNQEQKIETKYEAYPQLNLSHINIQIPYSSNNISSEHKYQVNTNDNLSNNNFISHLVQLAAASNFQQIKQKKIYQKTEQSASVYKDSNQINLLYDRGILPFILPNKPINKPQHILDKIPKMFEANSSSSQIQQKILIIQNHFDQLPKLSNLHIFSHLKIKDLKQNHKYFTFLKSNLGLIQRKIIEMKEQQKFLLDKYNSLNQKGIQKTLKLKRMLQFQSNIKNNIFACTKILNIINNQVKIFHPIIYAYIHKLTTSYSNPDEGVILMNNFIREQYNILRRIINTIYEQRFIKVNQTQQKKQQYQILSQQIEMICLKAYQLSQLQKKLKLLKQILSFKEQKLSQLLHQKVQKQMNQQWEPFKNLQECVYVLQKSQRLRKSK